MWDYWWALIRDLRTILRQHPRPIDELNELLFEVA